MTCVICFVVAVAMYCIFLCILYYIVYMDCKHVSAVPAVPVVVVVRFFFLISDSIVFRMAHSRRDENPLFLFNRENGMIVGCALLPICYLFDEIDKSHQWHIIHGCTV